MAKSQLIKNRASSVGEVEYIDCITAEGSDPPTRTQWAGAIEYTDFISAERQYPQREPSLLGL